MGKALRAPFIPALQRGNEPLSRRRQAFCFGEIFLRENWEKLK